MISFQDIANHSASDHYGWGAVQAVTSTRLSLTNKPPNSAYPSLQVVVQQGDDPLPSNTGDRSELVGMFGIGLADEDGASGTQFYGYSLYLPSLWRNPAGWCIPLQLHGPTSNPSNASSPAFSLDLSGGRYTLSQRGGADFGHIIRRNTDLGAHVYDQWIDFLFEVNWATDFTGYTAVWTRSNRGDSLAQTKVGTSTPITPWNTPTLYGNSDALPHYWKRGCYRSAETFTTMFYAGILSRADTMSDAIRAAFQP